MTSSMLVLIVTDCNVNVLRTGLGKAVGWLSIRDQDSLINALIDDETITDCIVVNL